MPIKVTKDEAFGQNVLVQFNNQETAKEFTSFTNDFTTWSAHRTDDEVTITVEELGEDGDDIDTIEEYCQRYIELIRRR